MDAKLKKIQITPVKFDKDGDVQKEEFATLTFEVPLDSLTQRQEVMTLFETLSREWVRVEVEGESIPAGEDTQLGAAV
ncbi:hypothetical protein C6502_07765 [Candidatus Poribacteria bacterium]|nr:MAG: hypothetical protein C6502_07765 [Candidatus Poribacteria bacterium]